MGLKKFDTLAAESNPNGKLYNARREATRWMNVEDLLNQLGKQKNGGIEDAKALIGPVHVEVREKTEYNMEWVMSVIIEYLEHSGAEVIED
jgi:hypothetical protein